MLRLIVLALAAVTLAGCIVVPGDGYRGYPHYHHDWR
jgi:hypothetical protein